MHACMQVMLCLLRQEHVPFLHPHHTQTTASSRSFTALPPLAHHPAHPPAHAQSPAARDCCDPTRTDNHPAGVGRGHNAGCGKEGIGRSRCREVRMWACGHTPCLSCVWIRARLACHPPPKSHMGPCQDNRTHKHTALPLHPHTPEHTPTPHHPTKPQDYPRTCASAHTWLWLR